MSRFIVGAIFCAAVLSFCVIPVFAQAQLFGSEAISSGEPDWTYIHAEAAYSNGRLWVRYGEDAPPCVAGYYAAPPIDIVAQETGDYYYKIVDRPGSWTIWPVGAFSICSNLWDTSPTFEMESGESRAVRVGVVTPDFETTGDLIIELYEEVLFIDPMLDSVTIPMGTDLGAPSAPEFFDVNTDPSGSLSATVRSVDSRSGVYGFEIWLDGNRQTGDGLEGLHVADDSGQYSLMFDGLPPNSEHTVRAVAYDHLRNASPQSSITIVISSAAAICLNPSTVELSVPQNDFASTSFEVWNCGGGTLTYTISDDQSWVIPNTTMGTSTGEHDVITVDISAVGQSIGMHAGQITVESFDALNSPQVIPVTMSVTGSPQLCINAPALTQSLEVGEVDSYHMQVWNCGGGTLEYELSGPDWLTFLPASGTSTGETDEIELVWDATGLTPGWKVGFVQIGSLSFVQARLFVDVYDYPFLFPFALDSQEYTFPAGHSLPQQEFLLFNAGPGLLRYGLEVGQEENNSFFRSPIIEVNPTTGSSDGEQDLFEVTFDTVGLPPGTYTPFVCPLGPDPDAFMPRVAFTINVETPTQPSACVTSRFLEVVAEPAASTIIRSFELWNCGSGLLPYEVTEDVAWMGVGPGGTGQAGPDRIQVDIGFDPSLEPGTYIDSLFVRDPVTEELLQEIEVRLQMLPAGSPRVCATPPIIEHELEYGQPFTSANFQVWNCGEGVLDYDAGIACIEDSSWISPSQGQVGSTPTTVEVAAPVPWDPDRPIEEPEEYTYQLQVHGRDALDSPTDLEYHLTILPATEPAICRSHTELFATVVPGQISEVAQFELWNCGGGELEYSLSDDVAWLEIGPVEGSSTGEHDAVTLTVSSELGQGAYQGIVTIHAPKSVNNGRTVEVTLTVEESPQCNLALEASPPDGGEVFGAGQSPCGSYRTVTAQETTGLESVNWTRLGDPVSGGSSYTSVLTAADVLLANVAPEQPETCDELILDFGQGYGVWSQYNESSWSQLTSNSAHVLSTGNLNGLAGDDLVAGFGPGVGIWTWYDNVSPTSKYHPLSPESLLMADMDGSGRDELVVDFGTGTGVWVWYDDTVPTSRFHSLSPKHMIAGDLDGNGQEELILDFGPGVGIWIWYNNVTPTTRFHPLGATALTTGDLDGNGMDELIIEFGSSIGIWIYYNNSEWVQFHPGVAEAMATGRLNDNSTDDLLVDLGGSGLWLYLDNTTWQNLNAADPELITTGDFDGDGVETVVASFGPLWGVYKRDIGTEWSVFHPINPTAMTAGNLDGTCSDDPQDPVTVTVDFSQDLGAFRNIAAGFLGHIDSEPFRPSASQLETNLRPYMWRNDQFCNTQSCANNIIQDRAYQAVTNNGGVFHKGVCNRFARRFDADCHSIENASPWDESGDGATWFQDCYDDAVEALSHDRNPQWDVWNEPNGAAIFRDMYGHLRGWELAETYRICHEALTAAYGTYTSPPELSVGGPSMSGELRALAGFLFKNGSPGQAYIAGSELPGAETIYYGDFGFLEYLNQRPGIGLDFLSLHLFGDEWVMDWARWIDILREAIREELSGSDLAQLEARWGEDLSGLPIYVNEMMGGPNDAHYSLDAGHTVVGFGQLHLANVDGAAKACWPDPADGTSGCANKTLDGLLIPDGGFDPYQRRPIWWAYKYYAELSGRETAVLTEYPRVHGVAAAEDLAHSYRVLLGFTSASRNGDPAFEQDQIDQTNVVLTGLPSDCAEATVTTKLLAPSDQAQAFTEDDLTQNQSSTEDLVDGSLVVSVDDLAAGNVLYITLSAFGCD